MSHSRSAEIARLEELRVAALEQLIEAELALGRHADVGGELEALMQSTRTGSACAAS